MYYAERKGEREREREREKVSVCVYVYIVLTHIHSSLFLLPLFPSPFLLPLFPLPLPPPFPHPSPVSPLKTIIIKALAVDALAESGQDTCFTCNGSIDRVDEDAEHRGCTLSPCDHSVSVRRRRRRLKRRL